MFKKLIKNSQPFGKKFQKTAGGFFLTHTVYLSISSSLFDSNTVNNRVQKNLTEILHCVQETANAKEKTAVSISY